MMDSINTTCANGISLGVSQLLFTQLISTLIQSYCNLHPSYPDDKSSRLFSIEETFDFIVVGAGSAGSAIANRLSEVPEWKVLLIEAGSDPPMESNIPALFTSLLGSKYDWDYRPQSTDKACRAYRDGCHWNKGKMLGGSSSMNAIYHTRGSAKDYGRWEQMGNPGWSYESLLKYFKKLEITRSSFAAEKARGYDGYVHVEEYTHSRIFQTIEIEKLLIEAFAELGYPLIQDLAAKMHSGLSKNQGTLDNGVRDNTARAYLVPIRDRENLVVIKETVVTKLLINEAKEAVGVEVNKKGEYRKIYCTKEIVLAAGAVSSPQILLLSGVGPKEHLKEFGIPVLQDLEVGFNLQDHMIVPDFYILLNLTQDSYVETDPLYDYLTRRTELRQPLVSDIGFIDTVDPSLDDYPDIQLIFGISPPLLGTKSAVIHQGYDENAIKWQQHINDKSYILLSSLILLRPESRGRIMLQSTNPLDPPKIITGYLEQQADIETLIRGVRFVEKLVKTKPFAQELLLVPVEECAQLAPRSDQFYECYIRNFGNTLWHATGSCKMGPASDEKAVVDSRLRVRGIKGLRVGDASIMPNIVSGNTNIPTIMIGEKTADLIKEDWDYHLEVKHTTKTEL